MQKNTGWILCIVLFLQLLQGCASGQKNVIPDEKSFDEFSETVLFFGLCKNEVCASKKDFVSEKEWTKFLDDFITPEFTNGLTVVDSAGRWINKSGKLIKERSKIVILLHPSGQKSEESIEHIRENYKTLFHQQSVLKIRHANVDVSF